MFRQHRRRKYHIKREIPLAVGGLVPDDWLETYPESVKGFLKSHGDENVTSIKVWRAPVNSTVVKVLNTISLGSLGKAMKKYGIDKLFHLGLLINDKYLLQKNEVLSFSSGHPPSNAQTIPIFFNRDFTIGEMVDKARKYQGDNEFFIYDPFSANCQQFVKSMLTANGIIAPNKFIDQKAEDLVKALPGYVAPVAKANTDIGGIITILRQKFG